MVEYKIVILKQALKDKDKIKQVPALKNNVDKLLQLLKISPLQNPPSYTEVLVSRCQDDKKRPPYEALVGDMKGLFSRRINRQHRLVYRVFEEQKTIMIVSMWSHYEF